MGHKLSVCSTIMHVCVQDEYRNLMQAQDLDKRLTWFVKDVLFVLAEHLVISDEKMSSQ